jgi:hypothetical protein
MKFKVDLEGANFVYEDPDSRYHVVKYTMENGTDKFFIVDGKPFLDNYNNIDDVMEVINRKRLINAL